jgi:hypothetical protein
MYARLFFVFVLGTLAQACKERGSSGSELRAADAATLARIKDHKAPTGGDNPKDTLAADARVGVVFSSQCGVDQSTVGLFKSPLPPGKEWAWFEEKKIRKWAAPAVAHKCPVGEEYDATNDFCWRPFVFHFFPVAQNPSEDHYLVPGTSPVMRVFKVKDAPVANESCKFTNSTGLIFVSGIRNPFLGESWFTSDAELLASLIAWNRSRPDLHQNLRFPFMNKLNSLPGYIQMVGNANGTLGGIRGTHDEAAITKLNRNIELAYKAGVRNLEIVTHSNGMITTQIALTEFSKQLKANGRNWQKIRDKRTPDKMEITLFHLQSAPSQKWAMSALDSFGNNSDFLPNAKWVSKTSFGVPYWGWEWDFSAYTELELHIKLNIEFFYNAPDHWTYPWTTSVGRYISKKWHEEVADNGYRAGISTIINHHACSENNVDICGPEHAARESLWDFPNPAFQNQSPIAWEQELSSGRASAVVPQSAAVGPRNDVGPETARTSISRLPDFICLDIEANKDHCKKIFNKQSAPSVALELPGITVCANKLDTNSPCKSNTCGDGICSLSETKTCEDCNFPAAATLCKCASGTCNETKVTCIGKICNSSDAISVNSCQCEAGKKVEACSKDDLNCLLEYTATTCLKKDNELTSAAGFSLQATWESKITQPLFDANQFSQ